MRRHKWKLEGDNVTLYRCRACGITELSVSPDSRCFPPEGPNPECHFPAECNKTGRCPRDPVCFN